MVRSWWVEAFNAVLIEAEIGIPSATRGVLAASGQRLPRKGAERHSITRIILEGARIILEDARVNSRRYLGFEDKAAWERTPV